MKLIFMGTPTYADVILKELIRHFKVVSIFTQPDKKVGRKKIITPPPVKIEAIKSGIELYQPEDINQKEYIDLLKELQPDFIIVAAYGQILKKEILNIAPCINLHASILPQYRGASPIEESILNGDKFTGVTAMLMQEGLDSGDMLGFSYILNNDQYNLAQLYEKLAYVASELIVDLIHNFNNLKPLKQHRCDATYVKKIKKSDSIVKFDNAILIDRKQRAYFSRMSLMIDSGLKIKELRVNDTNSTNTPGEILKIDKEMAIIGCKKGSLSIQTVQPPSKKQMGIVDYLRGKRLKVGDILL